MNQALTVGLDFPGSPSMGLSHQTPRQDLISLHRGVQGASGPLGQCSLVYMDDCLLHSPTLEQHPLDDEESSRRRRVDVTGVLEIFRCRQLYAKSSKCKFGRQELGFLGHWLSNRKKVCQWIPTRYSPSSGGKGVQTGAKPCKPSKPIFGPKSQLSKLAKGIR